jgi:hypothetical protein
MIRLLARPLTPLSSQQVVSPSQYSCVSPVELTDGKEGEVVGEEPNQILPSMYYSILFGFIPLYTNVWASETDLDTVFCKGKFFYIEFPFLKKRTTKIDSSSAYIKRHMQVCILLVFLNIKNI